METHTLHRLMENPPLVIIHDSPSKRPFVRHAVRFSLILVFALNPSCVAGQEPTHATPPLLSASEVDYPPFCIVTTDGQPDGFSIELLRAAMSAMGREVTFRTGLWADVKGWLEKGQVQALPLAGRTLERESTMDFTFPYMTLHGAIVVRTDTNDIHKLGDLTGKKAGVMKDDIADEFLRREEHGIEIHTTDTFETALRELSAGSLDAVVIQRLVALRLIQETGLDNLRVISEPIEGFRQDFSFAVKEGDRDTLALLNEGLALIMADGTYRRLHAKWFAALDLASTRRIVVGGDQNYPPFEFIGQNGQPTGYNVDLTRAIAKAVGLDIEIQLGPWSEVIQGLEHGDIDVIEGMFFSLERDLKFDFSPPHTVNNYVSVVRKGSGPPPSSVEELSGKRIIVEQDDIMHEFVLENAIGAQVSIVDTQETALMELSEGKSDCALVARLTALYCIKKNALENLIVGQHPFLSLEYCFAVSNNHRPLLAQFSEGLKVIEDTGEYRRIYEKWMGVYEETHPNYTTILSYMALVTIPLLLIIAASFGWSWSLRKQVALRTEALRRSEVQFRSLVEGAPDAIFVQTEFCFRYLNTAGCHLLGADSKERVLEKPVLDFFSPSAHENIRERIHQLNTIKKSVPTLEEVWLRLDGTPIPVEVSAVPCVYEGKDGAIVFVRDIRERKRSDEERSRLLQILESSLNEIYIFDSKTLHFEYVNHAALCNLGYTLATMRNMTPVDIKIDFTEMAFRESLKPLLLHELRQLIFTSNHRRADGTYYPVEVHLQLVELKEQQVFLAVILDISDRKKAESERERLMAAIEQTGDIIIITDPDGIIQYVNPAFEKVTGFSREEIIGQTPRILKSGKHDQAFYRDMWDTILSGRTWEGQITNKHKKGSLWTEETTISPVLDSDGQIVNFVAVKRDMTDKLQLEDQIRQSQKMDSVGRLAGGVAHDFNNNLQVILGYTSLALKQIQPNQPIQHDLEEIKKAAERSANLTRQLLAFARKQTVAPRVLDLNDTVEGMLKMLRRLIGEDIELTWIPGPGLWPVYIDPSQIDQILANLCVNARDAIDGIGGISIETGNITLDEAYGMSHLGFTPGEYVQLEISDTGCGMDKETLEKIFEPFFTTKETGKGTGLGLSTVYGIVKQNNGFINVYSEPGQGTTFKVFLPHHVGSATSAQIMDVENIPKGRGETILIAEDDPSILKFTRRILSETGYNVFTANTPGEAIRITNENAGKIDLLVTDVIMPEMNGKELAQQLQTAYPGLKCLYISGYTADVIVHRGVLNEGTQFLQKPFTIFDFAIRVREELDRET